MRARTLVLLIVCALVAVFLGFRFFPAEDGESDADDIRERLRQAAPKPPGSGAEEEPPVRVGTYRVVAEALEESLAATGELRAAEEVTLRSQVSGKVTEILFREGARVAAGDLLVRIDDAELQAELRRAVVRRDLAAVEARRSKRLLDEDTVSQGTYDRAAAELDSAQAEISLIEVRIERREIRAPFDGVVGLRSVSVGSYLTPEVPIATLAALDPIKIDFTAPERYAGRIRRGQSVEVSVTGQAGTFRGEVFAVEPRVDVESRTLTVRARAPNSSGRLFPGAFATVKVVLEVAQEALLVPSIALVPGLSETRVYVVEDGVARPRTVRVGARTDTRVEIREGIAAGDLVVTAGVEQVRPGSAVILEEGIVGEGAGA